MTTFAQWSRSAAGPDLARSDRKPKKYDIRIVDQFYIYCEAVARMHRHRDEVQVQSQLATRRNICTLIIAGGFLCYYVVDRISQVISLL